MDYDQHIRLKLNLILFYFCFDSDSAPDRTQGEYSPLFWTGVLARYFGVSNFAHFRYFGVWNICSSEKIFCGFQFQYLIVKDLKNFIKIWIWFRSGSDHDRYCWYFGVKIQRSLIFWGSQLDIIRYFGVWCKIPSASIPVQISGEYPPGAPSRRLRRPGARTCI